MALRRDILLGVIILAALHAVLSFGAIGLFSRMAPAINRILQANVVSLEACEDMLAALASAPGGDSRLHFESALAVAQANITEPEEQALLLSIQAAYVQGLLGQGPDRDHTISAIISLGEVNRAAMRRSDDEAKRLGTAGSWAAVFLAMASFIATVVVIRRTHSRVVLPLARIRDTLTSRRLGNTHRRCPTTGMSKDLADLAEDINGLLERLSSKPSSTAAPRGKESLNRAMLLHALDRRAEPSVFVSTRGDLLATNRAAMDRLASPQAAAIMAALGKLGPEGPIPDDPAIESATRVGDTELWFCVLRSETP